MKVKMALQSVLFCRVVVNGVGLPAGDFVQNVSVGLLA